jgi:methionyl-tRNA formyltransferase
MSESLANSSRHILFLGYSENETSLIKEIRNRGFRVSHSNHSVDTFNDYDLVVSFGFREKISKVLLDASKRPPVNLHISYLPWNRGAHPNFWSHWDGTPSGVTIHEVWSEFDTGPIIFQKMVEINPETETFEASYSKLRQEVELLFLEKFENILSKDYKTKPQRGSGSLHKANELPEDFLGWQSLISTEILRLEKTGFNPHKRALDLIDEIEKVRTLNNINWMDLLRVVARLSPQELAQITRRINENDLQIMELFKKLGNTN